MIKNRTALKDVRTTWVTVTASRGLMVRNLAFNFAMGGWATRPANVAHALVLLFACSTLEIALQHLRREGAFRSPSKKLGDMLNGSDQKLPWGDLAEVKQAVSLRNRIAHKRYIPERAESMKAFAVIERELKNLRLIP